eukprot:2034020-Rhodomonas_salina.2
MPGTEVGSAARRRRAGAREGRGGGRHRAGTSALRNQSDIPSVARHFGPGLRGFAFDCGGRTRLWSCGCRCGRREGGRGRRWMVSLAASVGQVRSEIQDQKPRAWHRLVLKDVWCPRTSGCCDKAETDAAFGGAKGRGGGRGPLCTCA